MRQLLLTARHLGTDMATCRYCSATGLQWVNTADGWRLAHQCAVCAIPLHAVAKPAPEGRTSRFDYAGDLGGACTPDMDDCDPQDAFGMMFGY